MIETDERCTGTHARTHAHTHAHTHKQHIMRIWLCMRNDTDKYNPKSQAYEN